MKSNKEKIINFLKNNEGDHIHLKGLSEKLKISYPTILKYCDVLEAKGIIEIIDLGNVKLVTIKK